MNLLSPLVVSEVSLHLETPMILLFFDVASSFQVYFQDAASLLAEEILSFQDHLLFYQLIILSLVLWILLRLLVLSSALSHRYVLHGVLIELV